MPEREVSAAAQPGGQLDAKALQARLTREIAARKQAEALIETKSSELHELNSSLEQMLTGSVKVLTDVVSMARPEVFQKAAKVQRWARTLVPALKVYRPWELDLAALLYPLGVIALPDEIASKYARSLPLTREERVLIEESPGMAFQLVRNIPRMESVARAIYYSRKGFDGSGFPYEEIKGEDIPRTARILHILIDMADAATGADRTRADGFKMVASRKQRYDLNILKIVYDVLVAEAPSMSQQHRQLKLPPTLLAPGDVLVRDVVDGHGRLMLAAGAEITTLSIHRLHTLHIKGEISGALYVERPGDAPDQQAG